MRDIEIATKVPQKFRFPRFTRFVLLSFPSRRLLRPSRVLSDSRFPYLVPLDSAGTSPSTTSATCKPIKNFVPSPPRQRKLHRLTSNSKPNPPRPPPPSLQSQSPMDPPNPSLPDSSITFSSSLPSSSVKSVIASVEREEMEEERRRPTQFRGKRSRILLDWRGS